MNNCSIRTQTHQLTPSHNTKLECEKLRRTALQSWIYTSMMMMMMILMLIMLCLSITILKQKRNHENCIVIHGNDFNLKILDKLMFYLDFSTRSSFFSLLYQLRNACNHRFLFRYLIIIWHFMCIYSKNMTENRMVCVDCALFIDHNV